MLACGQLGTDVDHVVALEIVLPDSGRVEVTDTVQPRARALNGRGDSVAATIYWSSLDTGIVAVVDSETGMSFAVAVGTGRLQARAGSLHSNPQSILVLARLTSASAAGPVRDTVTVSAPDSLSDSLAVQAWAGTSGAPNRPVAYAAAIYPAGATTVTFVPTATVRTDTGGIAVARLRLATGPIPDSVVVSAAVRRPNGTDVPGSPVTFVVEFRP
ncbi:MAG TPA: hypothetical protein VGQ06_16120 [Gemmatimonadales bacterium]|nr:hypothetical protein [Gemmatimonadales bacterium]